MTPLFNKRLGRLFDSSGQVSQNIKDELSKRIQHRVTRRGKFS